MSYGFSMAFTPCNSFERALMIGAQCSDLLRKPENTKHLINDNLNIHDNPELLQEISR